MIVDHLPKFKSFCCLIPFKWSIFSNQGWELGLSWNLSGAPPGLETNFSKPPGIHFAPCESLVGQRMGSRTEMASNPPDICGLFIWRIPASNSSQDFHGFSEFCYKNWETNCSHAAAAAAGSLNILRPPGLSRQPMKVGRAAPMSVFQWAAVGRFKVDMHWVRLHPALQVTPAHMSCACCLWFLLIFAESTICISYHISYVYIIIIIYINIYTWLLCSIYFYIVNIHLYIYI